MTSEEAFRELSRKLDLNDHRTRDMTIQIGQLAQAVTDQGGKLHSLSAMFDSLSEKVTYVFDRHYSDIKSLKAKAKEAEETDRHNAERMAEVKEMAARLDERARFTDMHPTDQRRMVAGTAGLAGAIVALIEVVRYVIEVLQ